MLIDYYGNAVSEAPIAFNGVGVSEWREIGYENYTDGGGGFEADGCFSWRDYGLEFGFVLSLNYHWWLVYESGWIWTDSNAGISQGGRSAH